MREYRRLWAACEPAQQFQLEQFVITSRAHKMPEAEIAAILNRALLHARPWRLTPKQLANRLVRLCSG